MDYEENWKSIDRDYWVWLAGFTDGDGCIGNHKSGTSRIGTQLYSLRFSLTQKDRAILDEIRGILGTGGVSKHTRKPPRQTVHHSLRFGPAASRVLCKFLYPHLRIKKAQALAAMNYRKPDNGSHNSN